MQKVSEKKILPYFVDSKWIAEELNRSESFGRRIINEISEQISKGTYDKCYEERSDAHRVHYYVYLHYRKFRKNFKSDNRYLKKQIEPFRFEDYLRICPVCIVYKEG